MVHGVLTNGAVVSAHVGRTPWHGAGWRMEIYGREGAIIISGPGVVTYTDYRLEASTKPNAGLVELPIPERLTTVPPEVPTGGPFNVAQALRRFAESIREGNARAARLRRGSDAAPHDRGHRAVLARRQDCPGHSLGAL